jgi:hypothetical protein
MESSLQALCVQLCDPNHQTAGEASKALCRRIEKSPDLVGRSVDHIFAPLYARLGERTVPFAALVDLLVALALLLERVDPKVLPQARSSRVFPLVMDRVLALLELPEATSSAEDASDAALRCAKAALNRWYPLCDTTANAVRLEFGFLAHLAVRFLGGDCRALCLRSASILKSSADACVDVETLAGFFPGVCTALVHLLLRGDFKLGSHVVVAVFGALRAWIARVLSDKVNLTTGSEPLTLEGLFRKFNRGDYKTDDLSDATPQHRHAPASRDGLVQVTRDAEWLARTSSNTADVLCVVLGGGRRCRYAGDSSN